MYLYEKAKGKKSWSSSENYIFQFKNAITICVFVPQLQCTLCNVPLKNDCESWANICLLCYHHFSWFKMISSHIFLLFLSHSSQNQLNLRNRAKHGTDWWIFLMKDIFLQSESSLDNASIYLVKMMCVVFMNYSFSFFFNQLE